MAGNRADYQGFCFGLQRILWGLFKKLVIADSYGADRDRRSGRETFMDGVC